MSGFILLQEIYGVIDQAETSGSHASELGSEPEENYTFIAFASVLFCKFLS